jgi:hypothetical protein
MYNTTKFMSKIDISFPSQECMQYESVFKVSNSGSNVENLFLKYVITCFQIGTSLKLDLILTHKFYGILYNFRNIFINTSTW